MGIQVGPEDRGFRFGETHSEVLCWVLGQMEKEGMVLSECDGAAGHALSRQWYLVTTSGDVYPEVWAGSLARYGEMMDLFFSVYEGAACEAGSEA